MTELERLRAIAIAARKVVAWLETTEASQGYYRELLEHLADAQSEGYIPEAEQLNAR